MFYSQAGQDQWVLEKTNSKKNGYFLDIGAYDGVNYSNTLYLEKNLKWNGICIEPDIMNYQSLIKNRNCICENIAVNSFKGNVPFSSSEMGSRINDSYDYFVECDTLENILIKNNAPHFIDYLSIDVEGNEIAIIEKFPFNNWKFGAITIEHNLYSDGEYRKNEIRKILNKNGYIIERENVTHNGLPFEDWYINKE
jgi:FkbM family methyltransferase